MGHPKGFLDHKRQTPGYRSVEERVHDFSEMALPLTPDQIKDQATRCMDCGVPFCHGFGCPVDNAIPEMNDLVYQDRWQQACDLLHSTNNFPEMTGRVCPAPCEAACTLAINDESVSIKHIEYQVVEKGFENGWIKPIPAPADKLSGKRIAVVGSGPAGLAAAQQLARAGHSVIVFEKDESAGGLLRYGIPDFKLDKKIIDRRLDQLRQEGVDFQCGVNIGEDISLHYLQKMFDCVCLTMGAGQPRGLDVPGSDLENVIYAMDFLAVQNRLNAGEDVAPSEIINAKDKTVVVIGGGDTGSDCVGTARRHGAKEIYQFEILPKPERRWSVMTKDIEGADGKVTKLNACEVIWDKADDGSWKMTEVGGSEFSVKADIVILAMGFVHVAHKGLVENLDIELDNRGNIVTQMCQTSKDWVFAAGDTVSGPSLVVRAIKGGRDAAEAIDNWLRQ
jgi:glutamate synthase (NADPH/NADH) small chain